MKEKIWNIGILGLGAGAEKHAEAIMGIKNAKLLSVSSRNMEKRRAWMQKYGCEACINPRDLFLDSRLDIIIVATPSGMHGENAIYALNTGHHVIVEKPLDITTARCNQIIRNEEKTGKRCFTVLQNRYSDSIQTIKKAIDEGRLGTITMASAYQKWWRDPSYYSSSDWKGTLRMDGGGCLMNQGIHALDLLIYLAGRIEAVTAIKTKRFHKDIETEDTLVSALEFESGALGTIECSTCSWPGTERRIEIRGTEGSIIAEDDRIVLWQFREEQPDDRLIRIRFSGKSDSAAASNPMQFSSECHRRQLEDIISALTYDEPCITDSRAGREAVHAVESIYESADTEMKIYL